MLKSADFPDLALMRQGVDFHFEISLRAFKVKVRPLTNLEIIQATAKAAEALEKLPEHQRSSITSSLMLATFQLEMASALDVGDQPKLTTQLLERMSPDEINHLWKQYVRMLDKVNPSFDEMTQENLDRLVQDLKKNSDILSILTDLSMSNLIALCRHLLAMSQE